MENTTARHGDFEYMLWKMEKDYKSYGIIDGLRNVDIDTLQGLERDYSNSDPMKFGIGIW